MEREPDRAPYEPPPAPDTPDTPDATERAAQVLGKLPLAFPAPPPQNPQLLLLAAAPVEDGATLLPTASSSLADSAPSAPPPADPGKPDAPGDATPPEVLRERLVALLRAQGVLHDAAVERALLAVPRHLFLPESSPAEAYADIAVATHWEDGLAVSSASQPAIVAFMLEQSQIAPGMRVLEIGAGTGYNAALLSELVGPNGSVTTIDIDPQITSEASAHLAAAGYPSAHVVTGDGAVGWPLGAPYDRIELTVGASDIAPAWFAQLAEGGLLTLPLWVGASDVSVAFRKSDGALVSESLTPCGFMRLRGQEADAEKWAPLPGYGRLGGARASEVAENVAGLLRTRARRRFWRRPDYAALQALALRHDGFVTLWTERPPGTATARRAATSRRLRMRFGLYAEGVDGPSLALFGSLFPQLLVFGGEEAEHLIAAETDRWRERRPAPVEQWRIIARPIARPIATPESPHLADVPPPEGTTRLWRRHFVFDVTTDPPPRHLAADRPNPASPCGLRLSLPPSGGTVGG